MLRRPSIPKICKIDMSPFIGVLICMLVIFFVMTPLYGCGYYPELPDVSGASLVEAPANPKNLTIGLTERDVFFQGTLVDGGLGELRDRIAGGIKANPKEPAIVLLKADIGTRFARVYEVMTACREAGATDVRLIAELKQPS